jgi:hypothetical protein
MDPKEWKQRSVGLPLDPAKQRDPEEDEDRLPGNGGREALTDLSDDNGGQRTEVGPPYDGSGDLQRGQRDAVQYDKKRHRKKE